MGRTEKYDEEKRIHYYFMLLKGDEVRKYAFCLKFYAKNDI